MEQAVTAKVKVTNSSKVLDETMETFSKAVQLCIDKAWEKDLYKKRAIHDSCYYEIREKFNLQAQLACNAISQAYEILKGLDREKSEKPRVKDGFSIRYNFPRCASINSDFTELSLSTIKGRKKFKIEVPDCFEKYLSWELKESMLVKDYKGRFFFCFTFSKKVKIKVSGDSQILGVDLGVNKLAVTSDNDFFGEGIKERRVRLEKLVAELQVKGTSASHKKANKLWGRWKRFMAWVNHNISKEIVEKLKEGDVIVMEDLSYIRETAKYNEWVHKWAFRQLQKFISYKATLLGIRVVWINPKNTSKRCSNCGSLRTSRHGGFFECRSCGFSLDADLNAARNIAHSYMEILGLAGSPVNLPTTRGRMNPMLPSTLEEDNARKLLPLGRSCLL